MNICGKTRINTLQDAERNINAIRHHLCYLPTSGGGGGGIAPATGTGTATGNVTTALAGNQWNITGTSQFTSVIDDGSGRSGVSIFSGNVDIFSGLSNNTQGIEIVLSATGASTVSLVGATSFGYDADYSANYTAHSFVDKTWVLANAGWGKTGTVATLTGNATLNTAGFSFTFSGNGVVNVLGDSGHGIHFYNPDGSQDIGKIVRGDDADLLIRSQLVGLTLDVTTTGLLRFYGLPTFASNALALAGGLAAGRIYRQGDFVAIVH